MFTPGTLGKRPRLATPNIATPNIAPLLGTTPSTNPEQGERPDLIGYFAARGTRIKELEKQLADLQESHKRLQEALQGKDHLVDELKSEVASLHAKREAYQSLISSDRQRFEESLKQEWDANAKLVAALKLANEAKAEAERKALAASAVATETQGRYEATATTKNAEFAQLKLRMQDADFTAQDQIISLEMKLDAETNRASVSEDLSRLLQQQLEQARATIQDQQRRISDSEARAAALERDIDLARANAIPREPDTVVLKNLRETIRQYEDESHEARQLKDKVQNTKLLEDRLVEALARAKQAEVQLAAKNDFGKDLKDAQELEAWKVVVQSVTQARTPEAALHEFTKLQQQCHVATDKAQTSEAELKNTQGLLEKEQLKVLEVEAQLEAAQAKLADMQVGTARLQRSIDLFTKERDSLLCILESYQADEADAAVKAIAQITVLESTIGGLRTEAREIEHAIQAKAASEELLQTEIMKLKVSLKESENQRKHLDREADRMGREIVLLQDRVGRGEYNPTTTKVLHFVRNPEAEAHRVAQETRIADLEAENNALKEQLAELEHKEQASTTAESSALSKAKVAVLNKKVLELEKKLRRLQEVFKHQITNFREACYFLFGYRVDMSSQSSVALAGTTVRLVPTGQDDAELVFKFKRDGSPTIVPTDYVRRCLAKEAEFYIAKSQSIPAFTANLTMDLFNRSKE